MHIVSKHLKNLQLNFKKNIDINSIKRVRQPKPSFKTNIGNLLREFKSNKIILPNIRSQWNMPPICLFLSMEAVFQYFKVEALVMTILITKKTFST